MRVMAAILCAAAWPAWAETTFPATLTGHALIPAATVSAAPADAPGDAAIAGKFVRRGVREETPGAVPGATIRSHGARPTGIDMPFVGQPLQGLSGFAMARGRDGAVLGILDNGFGSRITSPDVLLSFVRLAPDFDTGAVEVRERVWLRDPDRVAPFRIAYEGSASRHLTGADFDPESLQVVGDAVWIGEEFGPFLISATLDGVVTGVFPAMVEGEEVRSPDHPYLRAPLRPGRDYRVARSAGFEGLALQPGTGLLWAMFERPLIGEGPGLRALAFDPVAGAWTGDAFTFVPGEGATAIGGFNFIDATRALVIERDGGEGDPSLRCEGAPAPDCFPRPAVHKRLVLIDTARRGADGHVLRLGRVDLMDIADPDGLARLETDAARDLTGRFTMPFTTIESIMRLEGDEVLVAVDNNLPFSTGRRLDAALDTEFVRLRVARMPAAPR